MLDVETINDEWYEDSSYIMKHPLLDEVALKLSSFHSKYLRYWSVECKRRIALGHKLEVLKNEKASYYSGTADAEVYKARPFFEKIKTRERLNQCIDSDEDVQNLRAKLAYSDLIISMLERIMKEVGQAGYSVKTAVDFKKFEAGA